MTETQTPAPAPALALEVARRYHEAWAGGAFDDAMELIAPDITCHAPAGRLQGAEAFRGFMGPFAQMVRSTRLLAAYGDQAHAVLVYDTETPLVADAPGAEWLRVEDGRIVEMRIIFDRLPFDHARQTQARQTQEQP